MMALPRRWRIMAAPFLRSGFVRNVGILAGGTALGQAITILVLPILTRLYTPSDFELLAVFAALLGICSVMACLRYNVAIPLPERDADGAALLIISLLSASALSVLLAIPLLLKPDQVAALIGQPAIAPFLWLLPLGIWLAASYDALQFWASRRKRFPAIARTRVTRAVGGSGVQVGSGLATGSAMGLILGQVAFGGLGATWLAAQSWVRDKAVLSAITRRHLRNTARRFARYPRLSVPEAFFNTAGVQVPVIIIAAVAAGPEAGFVMLAMRVMGLPMALVGRSVSQVFLAEAPALHRDGQLGAFTRRTMRTLAQSGGLPLAAVGLAAPLVFPWVFGLDWTRAGVIVAWLTPAFILQFIASPVSMVPHVTGQVALAMWLQVGGAILRIGAVLCTALVAPSFVVEVYALSGALFYAAYAFVILQVVGDVER